MYMKKSELDVPELMVDQGIGLIIPVHFVWGIKAPIEYKEQRSKSIRKAIYEQGIDFYFDHPIIAGLLPEGNDSIIFIVNGHHRTREAPNHKIYAIPAVIFSLAVLANFVEKSVIDLQREIEVWTGEALHEFDHKYNGSHKIYNPPKLLRGVSSLEDLKDLSNRKNNFGIKEFSLTENA